MRLLKKIWNLTFLCSLFNTIKYSFILSRDHKDYDRLFYGDLFREIIRRYLKIELDEDWVGRLYGVINPSIDIQGKFDPNTMIIELDGNYTNNDEYVKNWIYKQLTLVTSSLFTYQEMYNYIDVDIKHVGPVELDNYLVVFSYHNWHIKMYWLKRMLIRFGILAAIAGILLIILL